MFFLVCKLYKLVLYIKTYFEHGQCFIWEFPVLAFTKTARLNTTFLAIFPDLEMTHFWSVSYICQACQYRLLFWMFWTFLLIGSYLSLLLNIFYHKSTAVIFRTVLFNTSWRLWKFLFFEENIFKVVLYIFFWSKN